MYLREGRLHSLPSPHEEVTRLNRIKTRERVNGIKMLDKGAVASERMRSAFIRTRQDAAALVDTRKASSDEYASESAEQLADNAMHDATDLAVSGTKATMRKGREAIQERITSRGGQFSPTSKSATTEPSAKPSNAETQPSTAQSKPSSPVEQGRRLAQKDSMKRRFETARRNVTAHTPTVIRSADNSAKTIKTSQRTVKSAEQAAKVSVKTAQVSQKAAAASAKAAQKSAQTARSTAKATAAASQTAAKAVATSVKAIIAAAKDLIAAIAGGGWVAVLIIVVVVLFVAVIASPFGIFFSGESASRDTVPASAAVAQVNYDFNARLSALQNEGYDDIVLTGSPADWTDVLAVFAVKVSGAEDTTATYVAAFDAERVQKLKDVFFDMTSITSHVEAIYHTGSGPGDEGWTETILYISVSGMTAEDAAQSYGFTAKQMEILHELLDERQMLRELIGNLVGESADAKEVLKALSDDLSPERREIIETACSLVGKVNYFWGGKSLTIGWDSRWGSLQRVWADGSSTTGTYRPFGLDCSGFVDWVFYNATDRAYYPGQGGGAASQHGNCVAISWSEAEPGDLVFYPEDSHVGIVCGRDDSGNLLVIHCASGYNNVVITDSSGFSSIGRPVYFMQ